MAPGSSGSTGSRERMPQPPPVAPEIIMVPSSLEAATIAELEGDSISFVITAEAETQPTDPASASPSSFTAPTLGVARVSTLVLPHALVTLNAGLVERLLGFILQPWDHRERAGHLLGDIINRIFPQLLIVSLLLFFLFFLSLLGSRLFLGSCFRSSSMRS